jgi:hypothetical protein
VGAVLDGHARATPAPGLFGDGFRGGAHAAALDDFAGVVERAPVADPVARIDAHRCWFHSHPATLFHAGLVLQLRLRTAAD